MNGLTSPLLNTTSVYTVSANEPIIQVCATANNGTVVSTNQNQVEIQWTTVGLDTLQIIAGNEILAYDTAYLPINVITLTGVEEAQQGRLATIQPNVFSDQTVIRFAETPSETARLVITNMLGQTIMTERIATDRISLFANQLGKGFYLAYLEESNKRQFIGRLVVQ